MAYPDIYTESTILPTVVQYLYKKLVTLYIKIKNFGWGIASQFGLVSRNSGMAVNGLWRFGRTDREDIRIDKSKAVDFQQGA